MHSVRPIRPEEYGLLEDFLYHAIYLPPDLCAAPRESASVIKWRLAFRRITHAYYDIKRTDLQE
jgi:hypothetical protein